MEWLGVASGQRMGQLYLQSAQLDPVNDPADYLRKRHEPLNSLRGRGQGGEKEQEIYDLQRTISNAHCERRLFPDRCGCFVRQAEDRVIPKGHSLSDSRAGDPANDDKLPDLAKERNKLQPDQAGAQQAVLRPNSF